MAGFFIDRPVFAWVIAILIMLAGSLAVITLPVAQYPEIAPPQIGIFAAYPGASAKTVDESVTQVIEQQMKGLDNLMYMYSDSNSAGLANLYFVFEAGANIDIAQVQVQNKLQLAMPLLPEVVQRQGISVYKSAASSLMLVSFTSEDNSMSFSDISDYVASYIQDPVSLLSGVGETTLYGAQYAMHVWLDPEKMRQYRLNPSDVIAAISEQNEQVAGGQVGAGPAVPGQQINLTINASSRLQTVPEFESIFIRSNEDGSALYLRDVARVELDDDLFLATSRYNGKPSTGLDIKLAAGANALETTELVKEKLAQLKPYFPHGLTYAFPYDTAPVVDSSISSVYRTLAETVVLVFLVMYLFLQSFRATIIPAVTIPVVLLGTFGVLAAAGFTINTLTLFGMVLAIGLLVDDAIVVVENVERLMNEEGLSPREAAKKSMQQITGALVGVALVISAVFAPMAFMGGSTGVIYRQFSITIVTAMALSVVIAIVLTPAMCATILPLKWHIPQHGFFGRFNRWFDAFTLRYKLRVGRVVAGPRRWLAAFAVCLVVVGVMFFRLPSAFLPDEDQGMMMATVILPSGATFERTENVLAKVENYFLQKEAAIVESVFSVSGWSFTGVAQSGGMLFVKFKDWSERKGAENSVFAVSERAYLEFADLPEAFVFFAAPPAVLELGTANGFDFELVDRAGLGHDALLAARDDLLYLANSDPVLRSVRHNGLEDSDQYELGIDLAKAGAQGLNKGEINFAVAAYWGGYYVNDFIDRGRTKKVYVQADAPFRMQANDFFRYYYVRNRQGEMTPFSSFMNMRVVKGATRLERFNGLPAVQIQGEAAPGKTTGQAMAAMAELAGKLPTGFGYEWTGISFQEAMSGAQAPLLYALSLTVVFLCLAALYESWTIPLAVLLVAPLGVIGAMSGVFLRGMSNDIYFQIGLLTVVALAAKNSVLIVEFAAAMHEKGMNIFAAAEEAARIRLRPILMTSLCFGLGVIPLAIRSGAGSGGQNAIGTTVAAGVLSATALGIYYTPIFFVQITRLFAGRKQADAAPDAQPDAGSAET